MFTKCLWSVKTKKIIVYKMICGGVFVQTYFYKYFFCRNDFYTIFVAELQTIKIKTTMNDPPILEVLGDYAIFF